MYLSSTNCKPLCYYVIIRHIPPKRGLRIRPTKSTTRRELIPITLRSWSTNTSTVIMPQGTYCTAAEIGHLKVIRGPYSFALATSYLWWCFHGFRRYEISSSSECPSRLSLLGPFSWWVFGSFLQSSPRSLMVGLRTAWVCGLLVLHPLLGVSGRP